MKTRSLTARQVLCRPILLRKQITTLSAIPDSTQKAKYSTRPKILKSRMLKANKLLEVARQLKRIWLRRLKDSLSLRNQDLVYLKSVKQIKASSSLCQTKSKVIKDTRLQNSIWIKVVLQCSQRLNTTKISYHRLMRLVKANLSLLILQITMKLVMLPVHPLLVPKSHLSTLISSKKMKIMSTYKVREIHLTMHK